MTELLPMTRRVMCGFASVASLIVMPGERRASTSCFRRGRGEEDVDARAKRGHDGNGIASAWVRCLCVSLVFAALAACTEFERDPVLAARDVVQRSTATMENFKSRRDLGDIFPQLRESVAVVILPRVIKGGFIGAGEGGTGVMLARRPDGSWGYPAFYTLFAGSVGLQIGLQDTEVVMAVKSERALRALIDHQAKLGVDIGISVLLVGKGMEGSTTAGLGQDIVAFANPIIGLFGGISLEGGALARRTDLNENYYGPGATPQAILLQHSLQNPDADKLRNSIGLP